MSEESDSTKSSTSNGCVSLIIGSAVGSVLLFVLTQMLFGSQRHDSSSGWNFAPLLPYLWPLKWLPVYWLAFVVIHPFVRRGATHYPEGAASNASMIAIIVYIVIALLARWLSNRGAFDFYG